MPLRDHFRPPLSDHMPWEGVHGQWPAMIVLALKRRLPRGYVAGPRIHSGAFAEVDVATFERGVPAPPPGDGGAGNGGGIATAVWAPPRPTFAVVSDLPAPDDYEVRVYDVRSGRRLVAAVEIVSPANKDRTEHRRAFAAKCAALLQQRVSVTIVDIVTIRNFNLYRDLLELAGKMDPSLEPEAPSLYAAACRGTKKGDAWLVEAWSQPLALGQALPTLPLWLADNLAVPLELEETYEDTCRALGMA